jgi:hypothetical protein
LVDRIRAALEDANRRRLLRAGLLAGEALSDAVAGAGLRVVPAAVTPDARALFRRVRPRRLLSGVVRSAGRLGAGRYYAGCRHAQDPPTWRVRKSGFVDMTGSRKVNILLAELRAQMVLNQPAPDAADAMRITDFVGGQ